MSLNSFDEYVRKTHSASSSADIDSTEVVRAAGDALFIEYQRVERELKAERALVTKLRCEHQDIITTKNAFQTKLKTTREQLQSEAKEKQTLAAEVASLQQVVDTLRHENSDIEARITTLVEERILAYREEHTDVLADSTVSRTPQAPQPEPPVVEAASPTPADMLDMRGALSNAYLTTQCIQLALPDHTDMEGDEVLAIIKSALQSVKDVTVCLEKTILRPERLTELALRKAQEEAVFLLMLLSQLNAMFSYCNDMGYGITDTPAYTRTEDTRMRLTQTQRLALLAESTKLFKLYWALCAKSKAVIGRLRDTMRKGKQSGVLCGQGVMRRDSLVVRPERKHSAPSTPPPSDRPLPRDDFFEG